MTKTPLGVVLPITTQSAARESQKSQSDNKNFSSPKGEGFQPSPGGTLKFEVTKARPRAIKYYYVITSVNDAGFRVTH
jgi:hypothetical protein